MNNLKVIEFVVFIFSLECLINIHASAKSDLNLNNEKYPIVDVAQGSLQGLERQTLNGKRFYSFKGIPYAQPPVGSLRFKDPLPAKPWFGIRNASEDGNVCAQIDISRNHYGDEDCLVLNVYTPSLPSSGLKNYPVIVYIHGGGMIAGSGSEMFTNPSIFLENDIVVVAINYRLGIFGFLSLDIPEVPGNAAFKDQLLSIKWVRENIKNFNGDPNNVTLHGLSAGSTSVEYQLLHSQSEGLFHKASMQSGSSLSSWSRPRNQQRAVEKLANIIGSVNEPYQIINTLSPLTTEEVLTAALSATDLEFYRDGLIFTQFSPVLEKSFPGVENFLTIDPLKLYQTGNYVKVPILMSFCRDEGNYFPLYYGEQLSNEILNRKYADFMGFLNVTDKVVINEKLTALYKAMNISEEDQMDEFLSDLMFFSGIYQGLKHAVKDTSNSHYSYMFSFVGNWTEMFPDFFLPPGAPHGLDMAFMMNFPESILDEQGLRIKNYLATVHTNFIKYGNPEATSGIVWDAITEESFSIMDIAGYENNTMIPFPFEERMKYWDSLFHEN